ncbi:TPA: hypothetical protein ACMU2U_001449 [Clostridioides difficile]|nr:hypothetical protein [Clostridioides difficile]MCI4304711.1 hypothetical protein [Clostridioides difficile]MCM4101608.1 hypothetical protein [Clostridioides difficile]
MQMSDKEIRLLKIQEKVKNKSILFLEKNKRILFNEKGVDEHVSKAGYGAGAVVLIILVITFFNGSLQNTILPALQSKIMNIFSI